MSVKYVLNCRLARNHLTGSQSNLCSFLSVNKFVILSHKSLWPSGTDTFACLFDNRSNDVVVPVPGINFSLKENGCLFNSFHDNSVM